MELDKQQIRAVTTKDLTEILVRVGIIAAFVFLSLRVFSPFVGLVLWGLVLAVTLYALSTTTIRSASMGVAGWAFIQAMLLGLGYAVFMTWIAEGDDVTCEEVEVEASGIPAASE